VQPRGHDASTRPTFDRARHHEVRGFALVWRGEEGGDEKKHEASGKLWLEEIQVAYMENRRKFSAATIDDPPSSKEAEDLCGVESENELAVVRRACTLYRVPDVSRFGWQLEL